ncbi:Eukaryotic translation initiation factor 3 subunit 10 [Liberibacter crescens BT-1]|uniref:Eukaryotic translation initiation factor 3 subunit 10 n=1 Tax=Liberibacter crescens (strain BT-1) TaxID=1215343 RepID=L0ERZ7_LIBCB|nr:DUF4167 domain-containing protein [Liberibacter crescens]AGA64274.1 Eukaryotic translation initiation factor 3 subunit 10 [Liberibacter crescens BT-1]AMC12506.1 hypothetical protein RL73_01585 [Liberibacter crescens]
MRPGQQQHKRSRGRSSNNSNSGNFNRKNLNPLTRSYDSSGPDIKIRGTAQHIAEKYSALARDAMSAGDYVMAENHFQHAEHYNRIIAIAQSQIHERIKRDERVDSLESEEKRSLGLENEVNHSEVELVEPISILPITEKNKMIEANSPQPIIEGFSFEVSKAEKEVLTKRVTNMRRRKSVVRSSNKSNQNSSSENSEMGSSVEESSVLEV